MKKSVSISPDANSSALDSVSDCDRLIEAMWLAAVIVGPLIFTQHGSVNFQPWKAAVVRVLGAITAIALGIRMFSNRGESGRWRFLPRQVGQALAFFLGAQVLAALFSVDPRASWWGILETSQGLFHALAEAALFFAVASLLRTFSQCHRLVSALIAASIPAALYALIQRAGFDPLTFSQMGGRYFSTLGHPIFLAAYLGMIMPVTWWRLIGEIQRKRSGLPGALASVVFYSGLALLQLAAFLGAQSRGPLLGLIATVTFFGLGWAIQTGQWRLLRRGGAVLGFALAFLVFLNLPLPASGRVARTLGVERFSEILRSPDQFRKAHWEAAVNLMTSPEAIVYPTGGSDRWHALRTWIGYGPETLDAVLPQRFIWPGTQFITENRLHNRVLDLWFATGVVGVVAYYFFVTVVFQRGLETAGLGVRRWTGILVPSFAIVGGVLAAALGGRGYLGLGLVLGFATGCGFSVVTGMWVRPEDVSDSGKKSGQALLGVALLAGLVGHLVETGFAFTVQATSLLFWLYAGMLLALGSLDETVTPIVEAAAGRKTPSKRQTNPTVKEDGGWRAEGMAAYGPALILVTLLFAFIQNYSVIPIDWPTVLMRTMTLKGVDQTPSHLIWFLFVPTWLAVSFLFARGPEKSSPVRTWRVLTISAGCAVAFAILRASQIAGIGPMPQPNDPPAVALAQISEWHVLDSTFVGILLAFLLGAAWLLRLPARAGVESPWKALGWNGLAIVLGSVVAWFVCLSDLRTDLTVTWGRALAMFDRLNAGIEVIREGVRDMPESVRYRRVLNAVLTQRAQQGQDFDAFDARMREAESSLLPATLEVHGLDPIQGDLAREYMMWAAFASDPKRQLELAQLAAAAYEKQQIFAPGHVLSWIDSAVLDEFLHRPAEAERKLEVAARFMNGIAAHWATDYCERTLKCGASEMRAAHAAVALRLFEIAIRQATSPMDVATVRLQRGVLELALGHAKEAREDCLASEPALDAVEVWLLHATMAELERQSGNLAEARSRLEKAIASAPDDKRGALIERRRMLQGP